MNTFDFLSCYCEPLLIPTAATAAAPLEALAFFLRITCAVVQACTQLQGFFLLLLCVLTYSGAYTWRIPL